MDIKAKITQLNSAADKERVSEMLETAISHLASINTRLAEELVEAYDGSLNYNNFLTENEAMKIVSDFVNQDGSHGAIWKCQDFFQKVESLGVPIECAPAYNKWALYVTACHFISDELSTISKWTNGDVTKYVEMACDLSIAQLNDRDKPKWIRWYFGL